MKLITSFTHKKAIVIIVMQFIINDTMGCVTSVHEHNAYQSVSVVKRAPSAAARMVVGYLGSVEKGMHVSESIGSVALLHL